MTLFPNNNTPRDKATYTFTIDVPTMLKTSNYANAGGKPYPSAVASNGELISKTPNGDGSRTTWVWNETKQMASELSMVSIGRYDVYESDITPGQRSHHPRVDVHRPGHLRRQPEHHPGLPGPVQVAPRLLRVEVRPLPGQQHRRRDRRRPRHHQLRPGDPGPAVLPQQRRRVLLPRDHAPVVGRQRLADRLERHHPQRGPGDVRPAAVRLRGLRHHHHHDRAGHLQLLEHHEPPAPAPSPFRPPR